MGNRWWKPIAACAALVAAAFVFRAWLAPPDPSLWLGAWIAGLCT